MQVSPSQVTAQEIGVTSKKCNKVRLDFEIFLFFFLGRNFEMVEVLFYINYIYTIHKSGSFTCLWSTPSVFIVFCSFSSFSFLFSHSHVQEASKEFSNWRKRLLFFPLTISSNDFKAKDIGPY